MPVEASKDAGSIPATSTPFKRQKCWSEPSSRGLVSRQDTHRTHEDTAIDVNNGHKRPLSVRTGQRGASGRTGDLGPPVPLTANARLVLGRPQPLFGFLHLTGAASGCRAGVDTVGDRKGVRGADVVPERYGRVFGRRFTLPPFDLAVPEPSFRARHPSLRDPRRVVPDWMFCLLLRPVPLSQEALCCFCGGMLGAEDSELISA